jgi:hypothetical protein
VRALGGGWSAADLPTEDGVLPFGPLEIPHNEHPQRVDAAKEASTPPQ